LPWNHPPGNFGVRKEVHSEGFQPASINLIEFTFAMVSVFNVFNSRAK
jgi:hypothetical protein